jgi:hypothetical protein
VANVGERLLAAAIFLALEVPLGLIAYRVSRRIQSIALPLVVLLGAVIVPDESLGGGLLLVSLLWMFAIAIRLRIRTTLADEERQLAIQGPSPWIGQSRRSSLTLIGVGAVLMLTGMALDPVSRAANTAGILLFGWGSIMLGMGLFRRHNVLVHYLGKARARRLEVVQVSAGLLAYGLAAAGEFSTDSQQHLALRLLSLIPFGLHFLFVWVPLAKAQERTALPETPFA